jgi:FMN reductase
LSVPKLKVATLDGSYFTPSKTTVLLESVARELGRHREAEFREISVGELGPGFTSALSRDELGAGALAELEAFEQADLVIAGSPVYKGSYTGLFKHFMDFVDPGALVNKPVLLVANGGSDRHLLMIDHELRPLFGFFQAFIGPAAVYASYDDFDGLVIVNRRLNSRISTAVRGLLPALPQ